MKTTVNVKAEISRIKFNLARNSRKQAALADLVANKGRRSKAAHALLERKLELANGRVALDKRALRVAEALLTYLPQVVAYGRPHLRAQGSKVVRKATRRKSKVA
jgi:hypothetical protein